MKDFQLCADSAYERKRCSYRRLLWRKHTRLKVCRVCKDQNVCRTFSFEQFQAIKIHQNQRGADWRCLFVCFQREREK